MKKTYIVPQICDIYAERLMYDPEDGQVPTSKPGDTEHTGSKMSNVTVWDDEDDNWGFSGF